MNTSPTPHEFMKRLTCLIELLDPMVEPEHSLHEQLVQSAVEVCAQQGIGVNHDQIAQAATIVLTQDEKTRSRSGQATPFDFGWSRPRTMTELETRRHEATTGWRGAWRRIKSVDLDEVLAIVVTGLGALTGGAMAYQVARWASFEQITGLPQFTPTLLGAIFAGMGLAAWAERTENLIEATCKGLEEASSTAKDMERWKQWPETRHHVRQCLFSSVPVILVNDAEHLDSMAANLDDEQRRRQQEEIKQQAQLDFRKAFLEEETLADPGTKLDATQACT